MQELGEAREHRVGRAQLADLADEVIDGPEAADELGGEPGLADARRPDDRDERAVVREETRELLEILGAAEESAFIGSWDHGARHPAIVACRRGHHRRRSNSAAVAATDSRAARFT